MKEDIKLNLDNIKVGDKFIGQPDLCRALGIEPKRGGSSKIAQEKMLKRYINYSKRGKTIKVLEIYPKPLESNDGRKGGNNSIYKTNFLMILSKAILRKLKNEEEVFFSLNQLAKMFGLINENYTNGKVNIEEISSLCDTSIDNVNEFYKILDYKINSLINYELDMFKKDNFFTTYHSLAIYLKDGSKRLLTDNELKIVDLIKEDILNEMDSIGSNNEVLHHFENELEKRLKSYIENFDYIYSVYKFNNINKDKLSSIYSDMKNKKITPRELKINTNRVFAKSLKKGCYVRNGTTLDKKLILTLIVAHAKQIPFKNKFKYSEDSFKFITAGTVNEYRKKQSGTAKKVSKSKKIINNIIKSNEKTIFNCVYRFLNNNNEIIYIGKTKNLNTRISNHIHLDPICYSEMTKIEYIEFNTFDDIDFAERYYIMKLNPKYNARLSDKNLTISCSELDSKMWCDFSKCNSYVRTIK